MNIINNKTKTDVKFEQLRLETEITTLIKMGSSLQAISLQTPGHFNPVSHYTCYSKQTKTHGRTFDHAHIHRRLVAVMQTWRPRTITGLYLRVLASSNNTEGHCRLALGRGNTNNTTLEARQRDFPSGLPRTTKTWLRIWRTSHTFQKTGLWNPRSPCMYYVNTPSCNKPVQCMAIYHTYAKFG